MEGIDISLLEYRGNKQVDPVSYDAMERLRTTHRPSNTSPKHTLYPRYTSIRVSPTKSLPNVKQIGGTSIVFPTTQIFLHPTIIRSLATYLSSDSFIQKRIDLWEEEKRKQQSEIHLNKLALGDLIGSKASKTPINPINPNEESIAVTLTDGSVRNYDKFTTTPAFIASGMF